MGEWSFTPANDGNISAAGFSVATESLLSIIHYVQKVRDKAIEALNELVQLPGARSKLLENWKPFVMADLSAVSHDIDRFKLVQF